MSKPPSDSQWICFRLASEVYAVPALNIQEIRPYSAPNPCPGSPDYVEGILDNRGAVITIFNGKHLITGKAGIKEASHIIVAEESLGAIGISVDAIDGMASFYSDQIQAAHHTGSEFIMGTVNYKGQLAVLVDLARCCDNLLDNEEP